MNTLKEWKQRLQVGVQVRQIWNVRQGDVDRVFTITGVQTNAVYGTVPGVDGRSWLNFPKRKGIEFTEKGWCIVEETRKIAEYEWVTYEWVTKEHIIAKYRAILEQEETDVPRDVVRSVLHALERGDRPEDIEYDRDCNQQHMDQEYFQSICWIWNEVISVARARPQ